MCGVFDSLFEKTNEVSRDLHSWLAQTIWEPVQKQQPCLWLSLKSHGEEGQVTVTRRKENVLLNLQKKEYLLEDQWLVPVIFFNG